VNGAKIETLDVKIKPGDTVCVDGRLVTLPTHSLYYALNKPMGYVVSNRRFHSDPTIYDLLPEELHSLKYAGRLDKNSRGLVILSNDGQFIAAVTHPGRRLTKRYRVVLDVLPPEEMLRKSFYSGVESEGEVLRAIRVSVVDREKKVVEVVLGEGKKRQIRRMFKELNVRVIDLYRVAVGFFDMKNHPIAEGKAIPFSPSELLYGVASPQEELLPAHFNPWHNEEF